MPLDGQVPIHYALPSLQWLKRCQRSWKPYIEVSVGASCRHSAGETKVNLGYIDSDLRFSTFTVDILHIYDGYWLLARAQIVLSPDTITTGLWPHSHSTFCNKVVFRLSNRWDTYPVACIRVYRATTLSYRYITKCLRTRRRREKCSMMVFGKGECSEASRSHAVPYPNRLPFGPICKIAERAPGIHFNVSSSI